jgi:branched-chain amino acid transport system substrate-binding protein
MNARAASQVPVEIDPADASCASNRPLTPRCSVWSEDGFSRTLRGPSALALLAALAVLTGGCERSPTAPGEHEVLLGGLFPLSAEFVDRGVARRAAMELAIEDVNRYLEGNAAGVRFAPAIEDTRFEPALALERTQALRARGVQLLIGPLSSAEVAHIKPYADANDLLVVSPSSTAGSLAVPGDNIFRFTPSDHLEGEAISAMMWDDDIRAVVPVWRGDPGNTDLTAATRARFAALGGSVLDGVGYGAATQDFTTTVAALRTQVDQAVAQHGAAHVAVYLAAFDEVVQLFRSADLDPVLASVRWYGSNGTARHEPLRADLRTSEFAMRVGFENPIFGLDGGARDIWDPLAERIRSRTGMEPGTFEFATYDAVWVVARAYVASGATDDIEKLKEAFISAAARHYGATGWAALDEAGDRRHGDYDFWAIRMEDDTPRWTRVAVYESRMGRLIR